MMRTKPLQHLDIVLSIFNQENLIEYVLYGILKNTTTPFTLIMVFDGCTDQTEKRARAYIKKHSAQNLKELVTANAPNVYETKANNIGFKLVTSEYMITIQDDMVITESGWERRLTYPLRKFDDVIAVTARAAQDIDKLEGDSHFYINRKARELGNLPRDIFAVRDIINRGPVAFDMRHLKTLNFLNEAYAPSDLDDADLSLRAWKQHKLRSGAYWIGYISKTAWGKSRAVDSTMQVGQSISRNARRIMNDHADYLGTGIKHGEDVVIPEKEVDYVGRAVPFYYGFFKPYRIHKKAIIRVWGKIRDAFKELFFRACDLLGVKDSRERGIKKIITFKL